MPMKALCLVPVLLGLIAPAAAQVVDVRALSRQRGYVAYQPKRQIRPLPKRAAEAAPEPAPAPAESGVPETGAEETRAENADAASEYQTREMMEYIKNNPQVQPDIQGGI